MANNIERHYSMLIFFFFFSSSSCFAGAVAAASGDLNADVELTWGGERGRISNDGGLLELSLDRASGSGFRSKRQFLFGKIDVRIKLVSGNSAGTVTAYYLSSQGPTHDEIDFEFLGNVSGEPYILHTNVFAQGKGNREQQFYLWFDPRADFHTYTIIWNPLQIIFYVDGTPIRVYRNMEGKGVPFPRSQAMRVYSSIWNADDWATRGGLVKTDWSKAPFTASYRGFEADACVWPSSSPATATPCGGASKGRWWYYESLDAGEEEKLKWARSKYMIYDYCKDSTRFPGGFPPECSLAAAAA